MGDLGPVVSAKSGKRMWLRPYQSSSSSVLLIALRALGKQPCDVV